MKTKRIIHTILAAAAVLGLAACTKQEPAPSPAPPSDPTPDDPTATETLVTVLMADYETAGLTDAETIDWNDLQACLFEEGHLRAVYNAPTTDGEARTFRIASEGGTLYLLTEASRLADLEGLCEAGIAEEEWLRLTAGTEKDLPVRFASGQVTLTGQERAEATMTRACARLDLRLRTIGNASVTELTLEGVARETPLFGPAETSAVGTVALPLAAPVTDDTAGVAYLYPQQTAGAVLRVEVTISGKSYTLESELPAPVRRNCIYVVTVSKEEADQDALLTVEAWEKGDDTDLYPDWDSRIVIDPERSELPLGTIVSADGTQITLPHGRTDFRLALACNDELEAMPATGNHLTIEAEATARSLDGTNCFRIRKPLFAPGMAAEESVLQFRRKGLANLYPEDRITVYLAANPVGLEGDMTFDATTYAFDFGRYIDNELGRFTVPAGKRVTVEFAADEDPWIRISPLDGNASVCRVVAGWKPNDPTANGRRQSATLVVSNTDGSDREEYTVTRRNYGLPVTWFHGVWWCKYNARGNSRNFEDQILSSADPAAEAGQTVLDYLRDCSPEAFYDLWGWAYQGDSGIGMRVVDNNDTLVMDGFTTSVSAHINKLAPDALSPDGYELPSMEEFNRMFDATDYVWIMWSGSHALRNPWEGHSTVKREQRRRNDIRVGSVQTTDLLYTAMWSPDFPEYEAVTWYGPGAQWDAAGIKHAGHYNNMLFAVWSPEGSGWYMAGNMSALYLQKNGAGNKDTRILRFKKSPVEYIYE